MNRDWLKQKLGESATDALVDEIMAANGKDVNASKSALATTEQRLAEASAKVDELTRAQEGNLSEAERFQRELDAANKRADAAVMALNEQAAAAVFAGAGISADEYAPFLGSIVTGDIDATKASAQSIAALVTSKVAAAAKQSKKDALGGMRPPAGGEPSGDVSTKAEFLKLPYEQQVSMKQADPGILSKLK